jgi:hypothetical protein
MFEIERMNPFRFYNYILVYNLKVLIFDVIYFELFWICLLLYSDTPDILLVERQ